jgi:hypothetical protein
MSQGIGGRSRNAAVGSAIQDPSAGRAIEDGEDEPILQNAVYENIGECDKVVYVFACEHQQGHPARGQGVDDSAKGSKPVARSHAIKR